MFRSTFGIVIVAALIGDASARAEKPAKVEIVKLGKQSTALVEVKNHGTGSAFCVHPSAASSGRVFSDGVQEIREDAN